jgi:hypothetical protein
MMRHPFRVAIAIVVLSSVALGVPPVAAGAAPHSSNPDFFPSAYWQVDGQGAVFGNPLYGSASGMDLRAPIVGMAATPDGTGYWLVAADGGVFSFGDAGFYGSMGRSSLNQPIVGIEGTPSGHGYWLVAADGGVFSFGDGGFHGSMGGRPLNQAIVGITATPGGKGYLLAAADGGVFAFGDAGFHGSMGGTALRATVVGITETRSGRGYWLDGSDGGVFSFGDAGFFGASPSQPGSVVGPVVPTPDQHGYWLFDSTASLPRFAQGFGDVQQCWGVTNSFRATGLVMVGSSASGGILANGASCLV